MIRTFYLGVVLGLAAAAALVYLYPLVDLHREPSLITVQANGGNSETFQINLPGDRIMAGVTGTQESTPPELEWPEYAFLSNIRTELFKVRNSNGVVIGTASRIYGSGAPLGGFVEWTVHLPARGSMFLTMAATLSEQGFRKGKLRAGTREFRTMHGTIVERFFRETENAESESAGRIELVTALIGTAEAAK